MSMPVAYRQSLVVLQAYGVGRSTVQRSRSFARDISDGKLAPGILLGAISLATGILNAACMTY